MENDKPEGAAVTDRRAEILAGFQQYVLENGQVPSSIYKFTETLNMSEEDFYRYFTSFEAVKSGVWIELFDHTLNNLYAQEIFPSYSSREKMLAFFFTWVEELKKNRSYLLALYERLAGPHQSPPSEVRDFREKYKEFASQVLAEGKETEEIAKRPFVENKYDDVLWVQLWFIFRFWIRDSSVSFEKTDVSIEKSVHLAFDLMGKSSLDSIADFVKFLYQNK